MRKLESIARDAAIVLATALLFLVAYFVGLRMPLPLGRVLSRLGTDPEIGAVAGMFGGIASLYVVVGAVTRWWIRTAAMVVLAALAAFLIGGTILKWSIHVTDAGTVAAGFPLWRYLVWVTGTDVILAAVCVGGATAGWWIASRWANRPTPSAESQSPSVTATRR